MLIMLEDPGISKAGSTGRDDTPKKLKEKSLLTDTIVTNTTFKEAHNHWKKSILQFA